MSYRYEKYEDGKIVQCPINDKDGSVTGRFILNVPRWFDENPEERKRLGWILHIEHKPQELLPAYNPQTQFATLSTRQIDEWTVEDQYHIIDKSEDQLAFEEMLSVASWGDEGSGFVFF